MPLLKWFSGRRGSFYIIVKQGDSVVIPADARFFKFLINNGLQPAEGQGPTE